MAVDITPAIPQGKKIITSYGEGGFKVNETRYTGSLIVMQDKVIEWHVRSFEEVNIKSLEQVTSESQDIEILLIGTGKEFKFADQKLANDLKTYGISVEVMDTGAACRTYNILLAEERRVAAALIAV